MSNIINCNRRVSASRTTDVNLSSLASVALELREIDFWILWWWWWLPLTLVHVRKGRKGGGEKFQGKRRRVGNADSGCILPPPSPCGRGEGGFGHLHILLYSKSCYILNPILIIITVFWLAWHQTESSLAPYQSEKCNHSPTKFITSERSEKSVFLNVDVILTRPGPTVRFVWAL